MHNLRQMLNFYIPLSEKGSQLLSQKIIPRHEFIELSYLQSRQGPFRLQHLDECMDENENVCRHLRFPVEKSCQL